MRTINTHRTTIDAEREFDLWLTFVGTPSHPMSHKAAAAFKPSEAEIEQAAYFIWVESGRPDGRELEHWLAAKEQLSRRSVRPGAHKRRAATPSPKPADPGRPQNN